MITNEQQYRATKKARDDMQSSLDEMNELELVRAGIDPVLIAAQKESLTAAVGDLNRRLADYAAARESQNRPIKVESIDQIGNAFIAARISNGWTQQDLAARLGLKQQQIQRYEKEKYSATSLARIGDIASILGLSLDARFLPTHGKPETTESKGQWSIWDNVSCFPTASMKKRGWLDLPAGRNNENETKAALAKFFGRFGASEPSMMLNKRTSKVVSDKTLCALTAWQTRVRAIAQDAKPLSGYRTLMHSDFKFLASLTREVGGPLHAIEFIESKGIRVVILPHLEHTLLDGSSMLMDDGSPVLALTLRHDRLDNFWHVFFHEIGHIVRHWNQGLRTGFIDDEGATVADVRETEADDFSRNALISDEIWASSFVRYANSRTQLEDFAGALGVGVSVVAGRLRKEKGDYTLWSNLVGYGKVRKLFASAGRLES